MNKALVVVDEPCPWCGTLLSSESVHASALGKVVCAHCEGRLVPTSQSDGMTPYMFSGAVILGVALGSVSVGAMLVLGGVSWLVTMLSRLSTVAWYEPLFSAMTIACGVLALWVTRSLLQRAWGSARVLRRLTRGYTYLPGTNGGELDLAPVRIRLEGNASDEELTGAPNLHTDAPDASGGLSQAQERGGLEQTDAEP